MYVIRKSYLPIPTMHLVYDMTEIAAFILVPFFPMMAQSLLLSFLAILKTETKVKVAKLENIFSISSPHRHNINCK